MPKSVESSSTPFGSLCKVVLPQKREKQLARDEHSLTEHLEYGLLGLRLLALAVHVRVLGEARRLADLEGRRERRHS